MAMRELSSSSQVDSEFDQLLIDMKPFIIQLFDKLERQKCALWIKKFCEPASSVSVPAKKNRNSYARLLLSMLRRKAIEGPFINTPDSGPLPTLPSYMSVFFTDDQCAFSSVQKSNVPDWVTAELPVADVSTHNSGSRLAPDNLYFSSSSYDAPRDFTNMRDPLSSNSLFADGDSRFQRQSRQLSDASDDNYRPRFTSTSAPAASTSCRHEATNGFSSLKREMYSSDVPFTTSALCEDVALTQSQKAELEIRTKMIEARYQEEALNLQHQHDCNVKKILDRKNAEINEMKQRFKTKNEEQEATIKELDKKVVHLQQELTSSQELRDQQLADLQRQLEENVASKQALIDRKIHDLSLEHEQQKYELQKRHTVSIQELMEETNARLNKMQQDYDQLMESTSSVIRELESRVQQLSVEVENVGRIRQQLEKHNRDLESQLETAQSQLSETQNKLVVKDAELHSQRTQHEEQLNSLRIRSDACIDSLKRDLQQANTKTLDTERRLEQDLTELRRTLDTVEQQRILQIKELERVHEQNKKQLSQVHQLEVEGLHQKCEQQDRIAAKKLKKLEQIIVYKDSEIQRLMTSQVEQSEQSQRALDEFKGQVEKNSAKMYEEMKSQLEKVEDELTRCKVQRDKQLRDAESQRDELIRLHGKQLAELKMKADMEQARMEEDFHLQAELRRVEKDRELTELRESHQADLADVERRVKDRIDKEVKIRHQLESQVQRLRNEVIQVNQQRKQELMELRVIRDQEKHTIESEFDAQLSRLRSQMDEQRLELERQHSFEMEKLLEATNEKLKEIETDYITRNNRSTETIGDLQATVDKLKAEIERQRANFAEQLSIVERRQSEDKLQNKQRYTARINELQQELNTQRNVVRQFETKISQQLLDEQEKLTQQRSQYEERLRGMIPADVRQELEDTICSLRQQIVFLQQRATVLQEDLNCRSFDANSRNALLQSIDS